MVSYKEPEYTVESNVMGTLNLLKPFHLDLRTQVLLASSTAACGFIDLQRLLSQSQPFARLMSGMSAAQDLLGSTYLMPIAWISD